MLNYATPLGGLNIKAGSLYGGPVVNRVQHRLENSVLKIETQKPGSEAAYSKTATDGKSTLAKTFAASLLANILAADRAADEKSRHSEEESAALVKSVAGLVGEVKESFGDAEANRLMANLLLATDGAVSENRIAGTIADFLAKLKEQALGDLRSPASGEETLEKAKELLDSVYAAVDYLNNGDGEGEEGGSLTAALNGYFGKSRIDEELKSFTYDLKWISAAEAAAEAAAAAAEAAEGSAEAALAARPELYVLKSELGQATVDAAVSYLTEELAAKAAAGILADLREDEDLLEAVDKVRERLEAMDRAADEAAGESGAGAAAIAVTLAASEASGDEGAAGYTLSESAARAAVQGAAAAAAKSASKKDAFDEYLRTTMTMELNRAVKEDARLAERLQKLVSLQTGLELLAASSISIGSWPGLGVVHSTGFSVSVGWKREFSVSVDDEGKVKAGMSESVQFSASFTSTTVVGVGFGYGSGAAAVGAALTAAASLDLAKSLEQSYSQARIGANRAGTPTVRSFLLSKHV
ncbi:MAG: hypothetical protein LBW85_04125 [Deltaproteobacteria bacterium]|jgi:hypothetical protein|nr:hypothetical protein [Deltaproteobacteria bacterium]